MSILCKQSIQLFQQKAMVQVGFPVYALSTHKQNASRITKGNNSNRISPSHFYSITNVHLVDSNVFAKFDEIPSLPIQDIKVKTKCCGQRITKGNNSNRICP